MELKPEPAMWEHASVCDHVCFVLSLYTRLRARVGGGCSVRMWRKWAREAVALACGSQTGNIQPGLNPAPCCGEDRSLGAASGLASK